MYNKHKLRCTCVGGGAGEREEVLVVLRQFVHSPSSTYTFIFPFSCCFATGTVCCSLIPLLFLKELYPFPFGHVFQGRKVLAQAWNELWLT